MLSSLTAVLLRMLVKPVPCCRFAGTSRKLMLFVVVQVKRGSFGTLKSFWSCVAVAAADAEDELGREHPVHVARQHPVRELRALGVVGPGRVEAVQRGQQAFLLRPAVVVRHARADVVADLRRLVGGDVLDLLSSAVSLVDAAAGLLAVVASTCAVVVS